MFLERLLNQGNLPLLEENLRFTSRRHSMLAENVANIDTEGYVQKDLDVGAFQKMLARRVEERASVRGVGKVSFEGLAASGDLEVEGGEGIQLFHDGQKRSMERLMSESAKNALTHNLFVELMRRQFSSIDSALKERVG